LASVPLRVGITGTRGKSSVTRLIAAILSEAGFRVLAKTTGSKPVLIFPDAEEKEISRRGTPSIIEGKKILKIASSLQARALVSELMSISPECGFVESRQMLKPQILAITNVRLDHLALMGSSKQSVARSLASSIPQNATVFVPEEEFFPVFEETASRLNSKVVQVPRESSEQDFRAEGKSTWFEFEENIRLALAVAEFLGIEKEKVLRGLKKVNPDFGSLKVWTAELGSPPRRFYLASGFAANDPQSTRLVLSSLMRRISLEEKEIIGLLNLRQDRGDRTIQWLQALKQGVFPELKRLFFVGGHALALRRRLKKTSKIESSVIKEKEPQKIMEKISAMAKGETVLFGMGNMGGAGKELVNYWEDIGKAYDL
jgi:poly-gamma-glutamate synthase PgsB/CapB